MKISRINKKLIKMKQLGNNEIICEGAKFSTMDFHHIGPDGSEPMGRQQ